MTVLAPNSGDGMGISVVDRNAKDIPEPPLVKESALKEHQNVICLVQMGLPMEPATFALTFDVNGESKIGFTRIQRDDFEKSRDKPGIGDGKVLDLTSSEGRMVMPGLFDQGIEIEMVDSDPLSVEPSKAFIKIYGSVDLYDEPNKVVKTKMSLENFLTLFKEENFGKTLVRIQKGERTIYALRIPTEEKGSSGIGLDMLLLLTDKANLTKSLLDVNDRADSAITKDILTEVLSKLRDQNLLLNAQIQAQLKLSNIPQDKKLFRTLEELKLWGKYMYSKEGKYYSELGKLKSELRRVVTRAFTLGRGRIKYKRSNFSGILTTQDVQAVTLFVSEPAKPKQLEKPKEPEGFKVNLEMVWTLNLGGPESKVTGLKIIDPSTQQLDLLVHGGEDLTRHIVPLNVSLASSGVPSILKTPTISAESTSILTAEKEILSWSKDSFEVNTEIGTKYGITLEKILDMVPSTIREKESLVGDEIVNVIVGNGTTVSTITEKSDGTKVKDENYEVSSSYYIFTKKGACYKIGCFDDSYSYLNRYELLSSKEYYITINGYRHIVRKDPNDHNPLLLARVYIRPDGKSIYPEVYGNAVITRGEKSILIKNNYDAANAEEYVARPVEEVSVINSMYSFGKEKKENEASFREAAALSGLRRIMVGTTSGEVLFYGEDTKGNYDLVEPVYAYRPFSTPVKDIVVLDKSNPLVIISSAESGEAILFDTASFREVCKINIPKNSRVVALFQNGESVTEFNGDPVKNIAYNIPRSVNIVIEADGKLSNSHIDIKYNK